LTRSAEARLDARWLRALPLAAAGITALALALAGFSAAAQSTKPAKPPDTYTQDDLRRVETARDAALKRLQALEKASSRAERQASAIDADLIAAAADSRRREVSAATAESRLIDLDQQAAEARDRLIQDEASLDDLLAALMTFGSRRPPALAASPDDAASAIRAAILMGEAAPALSARARALAGRIETLEGLLASARRERETLNGSQQALAARAVEISALASEKRLSRSALSAETAALRAETARLVAEADTLRDLLASLAAAAPARPGVKAAPRGMPARRPPQLPSASRAAPAPAAAIAPLTPAIGDIVRRFGESAGGVASAGQTLRTRAGAQVVSPMDARVEYAGVFRSYGQMLILDVGGDMLVIMSGLGDLYPEPGQWVLSGEPVGRMSGQKSPSPELYLEVRRKGQPVDPGKWLGRGA